MAGGTWPHAPSHYLRPNEAEWSPPVVIYFDTEAWRQPAESGEKQTLRLWAARRDIRRHPRLAGQVDRAHGTTAAQLAAQVDAWTAGHDTAWCYAHNLDYDLQLSAIIGQLGALGWTAGRHALASTSPWIVLHKGSHHRLTFADSLSWLRRGLADIAPGLGKSKPALPGNSDPDAAMFARCLADVDILAGAMRQLLDWWDRERCGKWSYTGSATAWNHWRHKWTDGTIHIGRDDDGCTQDRQAIYGGARGAARFGRQQAGPYAEYDFRTAYAHIARLHNLPHGRLARFGSAPLDDPAIDSPDKGMIAEVTLRTEAPRWPLRTAHGVIYPAGQFTTVLASPDIAEARRLGALVSIGPGRYHRLGSQFRDWAKWSLKASEDGPHGASLGVRLFAKQAGRSVIGKTAQHGYPVTARWDQPGTDWYMETGILATTGAKITRTVIAGRGTETTEAGDGDNAYPAILAFVESYCRVYLMRAINAAGPGAIMAWDTDGMTVDLSKSVSLDQINAATRPLRMRRKALVSWLDIRGPQMIFSPAGNKTSGIPRNTRWNEDGTGEGETWPTLTGQMSRGKEGEVMIATVRFNDPDYSAMGWLCNDGTVIPPQFAVSPDGQAVLLPFDQTDAWAAGRRLADAQSPPWQFLAHVLGAYPDCPGPDAGCQVRHGAKGRHGDAARHLDARPDAAAAAPRKPPVLPRAWVTDGQAPRPGRAVRRQRRKLPRSRRRRHSR